jgi:ketosteroid isomerase-like protein
MVRRTLAVVAVVVVTLAAWGVAVSQSPDAKKKEPDVRAEVMAADRAFAAAAADKGLDGWMSFMADDAVRVDLGDKGHVGKAAVKEHDAELFADPKKLLVWEPADGGGFADGKTGFTTGKAQFVAPGDKPDPAKWTHAYITIWRKGDDGQWKVILDTGSALPKK